MAPSLGYWAIRGRAQPIRFLLEFTGTEYEEKLYTFGPPPSFDRSEWLSEKHDLGLQFPNLPYYVDEDDDIKITESSAILRHLARKNDLAGSSEADRIKIDMATGILDGLNTENVMLCYNNNNFDEAKEKFVSNIDVQLQKVSDLLGGGDFILGDQISFVDFCVYETLARFEMVEPTCLAAQPELKAFQGRVSELPAIEEYLEADRFEKLKTRFNGRMAVIGVGEYGADE